MYSEIFVKRFKRQIYHVYVTNILHGIIYTPAKVSKFEKTSLRDVNNLIENLKLRFPDVSFKVR